MGRSQPTGSVGGSACWQVMQAHVRSGQLCCVQLPAAYIDPATHDSLCAVHVLQTLIYGRYLEEGRLAVQGQNLVA